MKNQLNNQKSQLFKGKITKSHTTFSENKPNFINIKIDVSPFETSKYEISPARRGKKTNPIKPNSNPIAESPKMSVNLYNTMKYRKETALRRMQTNPNKAKFYPRRKAADDIIWIELIIDSYFHYC